MNLQENIYRIQSLITEDKEKVIKNMINKHGLYDTIKMMGYQQVFNVIDHQQLTNEDKIKFIKEVITRFCEQYGDDEVDSFTMGNQIEYGDYYEEIQVIGFYSPEYITVECYKKQNEEVEDDDYDDDYVYLGGFNKAYEDLQPSLLDKIFHLTIEHTK